MSVQVIRLHRARAAARLIGEASEIGLRTEAARRHVVDGLLGLLGCAIGAAVHDKGYGLGLKRGIAAATLAGFDRQTMDVFQAHQTGGSEINPFHRAVMRRLGDGPSELLTSTNAEIVTRDDWDRSVWINEYVRPARVDHFVGSVRKVGKNAIMAFGCMRAAGDRPFTEEDREALHLVHLGVGRLFEMSSPRATLTPRMRDTLDVLLTGATDKEIAVQIGISPHTVREYLKSIFKAYGVSSRAQIIAREAAKKP